VSSTAKVSAHTRARMFCFPTRVEVSGRTLELNGVGVKGFRIRTDGLLSCRGVSFAPGGVTAVAYMDNDIECCRYGIHFVRTGDGPALNGAPLQALLDVNVYYPISLHTNTVRFVAGYGPCASPDSRYGRDPKTAVQAVFVSGIVPRADDFAESFVGDSMGVLMRMIHMSCGAASVGVTICDAIVKRIGSNDKLKFMLIDDVAKTNPEHLIFVARRLGIDLRVLIDRYVGTPRAMFCGGSPDVALGEVPDDEVVREAVLIE